jgi:D-alanyl-D-alanine endopeptidase (penicillin-binding protein 7)
MVVALAPAASFAQADPGSTPVAVAIDQKAAEQKSLEPKVEPGPAPLEPVFISNVPGAGQALPEPIPLTGPGVPANRALVPHKGLAIVFDAAAARRFRSLKLGSTAAIVVDQTDGHLLYAKNADVVRSIASISKLMTAIVLLDSGLPLDETIVIEASDVYMPSTRPSRLRPGMSLTRGELLQLALMASENAAAAALARSSPGGTAAFVAAMNAKASSLGMRDTRFLEPTGLSPSNVSTAYDLALLADAGYGYPLIREFTTSGSHELPLIERRRPALISFYNSNALVRSNEWRIGLSKTGFINEAGRCVVMQATIADRPVIIVLLDSNNSSARAHDAFRVKHWLEGGDSVTVGTKARQKRRM